MRGEARECLMPGRGHRQGQHRHGGARDSVSQRLLILQASHFRHSFLPWRVACSKLANLPIVRQETGGPSTATRSGLFINHKVLYYIILSAIRLNLRGLPD